MLRSTKVKRPIGTSIETVVRLDVVMSVEGNNQAENRVRAGEGSVGSLVPSHLLYHGFTFEHPEFDQAGDFAGWVTLYGERFTADFSSEVEFVTVVKRAVDHRW
jgi:hypothetical protein